MAREAVVVESLRTPLAKSFRGSFNITRPDDMVAHCIQSVLKRVPQVAAAEIEDVIIGCGYPEGQQGSNVARIALLRAGLPTSVAGTTVNRFCSSGLQAIAMAAHEIIQEGADVAISYRADGGHAVALTAESAVAVTGGQSDSAEHSTSEHSTSEHGTSEHSASGGQDSPVKTVALTAAGAGTVVLAAGAVFFARRRRPRVLAGAHRRR